MLLVANTLGACQAVATANVNIASPGSAFSGFTLTHSGTDRLLLTGQSGSQNGPWVWNGAASALTRPTDYPSGATVGSRIVTIANGSGSPATFDRSIWVLDVDTPITVDTTATVWVTANTGIYAPLASPALTGSPTAPTQTTGDDTTNIATDQFVQTASGLLIPLSTVTTKGDLIAGTASATVARLGVGTAPAVLMASAAASTGLAWESLTNGYGIAGFAATPPVPAIDLTTASGAIGMNVGPLSASNETTVITTASLGVGTWLVRAKISWNETSASTLTHVECRVNGGTATYSTSGIVSGAADSPSVSVATAQTGEVNLDFVATVTVAGTIVVTAYTVQTNVTVVAATPVEGYAGCTGYTGVRIA